MFEENGGKAIVPEGCGNVGLFKSKSGLSPEQISAVSTAMTQAKSLEELKQLEKLLDGKAAGGDLPDFVKNILATAGPAAPPQPVA